ncbi:unnamed protein product [Porites lobata]|uniref:Small ribosomal subunit protein mS40 n=1 Tax=Porites lobata TaxID=104759 RepID=A0ABN8QUI8_9CNID|nr:unnamed protein product [Porites lobata]
MAASFRVLSSLRNVLSLTSFKQNVHQKLFSLCLRTNGFHSWSPCSWMLGYPYLEGIRTVKCTRMVSNLTSNRVLSPVMAELLKSIQYGKEKWMDQQHRLSLVKRYEDGIIDHHSTEYEKLTLEHFQVFWPDGAPIWINYRRNFLGQFAPKRTRERCIRRTVVCSNPCPLCQLKAKKNYDLVYTDVGLLSQFISPYTGLVLEVQKTGVCRRQQKLLLKAIEEAKDKGVLPFTVPGPRDPPRRFKPAGVPFSVRNKT